LPVLVRPPRPADEGASKNVFKVALFKMISKGDKKGVNLSPTR